MDEYSKPLPVPDLDSAEHWKGCKRHELLVQRCNECGRFRWPPGPACTACGSFDAEWVRLSGKGKIYTYTVTFAPIVPGFEPPWALVLVELNDAPGIRMISNMVDCKPEDIKIGMPVEVVFDDVTNDVTLVKFRPAS